MEKVKKIFSSHPILWTLLILVIIAAIGLLIWFAPAFSLKESDIPVRDIPVTTLGEVIPVEDNYKFNGANKRKSTIKRAHRAGSYRKAVFYQYQKGRENLVPFAHFLACKV